MNFPLRPFLRSIQPWLPESLFRGGRLPRAAATAARVQRSCRGFGFEVRLSGDDDRVDFGTSLLLQGSACDLAGSPRHGVWNRIRRALRIFVEDLPASPAYVFFEFDDARAAVDPLVPSVFVPFFRPDGSRHEVERPDRTCVSRVGEALDIYRALRARSIPEATTEWLGATFAALPDASVTQVGVMLSRRRTPLRLTVACRGRRVAELLVRAGWTDSVRELEGLIDRFRLGSLPVQFELDVDGPSAGLAIGGSTSRLRGVAARLVAQGLSDPEKTRDLFRWVGTSEAAVRRGGFPVDLRRELSHLKIVRDGSGALGAKAYLTVSPALLRTRSTFRRWRRRERRPGANAPGR